MPAGFHRLRHTAASLMLERGAVSVRTVSEILGHSTTADVYGHVAHEKTAALNVIHAALSVPEENMPEPGTAV